MRRAGRGSNERAPWRGRDDERIPSALHLDRGWPAVRSYVKVVGLAACTIAISILIWRLRLGCPPGLLLRGHSLASRDAGIVFPLYRYYQGYAHDRHAVGGREHWRGSRGEHGRDIRSLNDHPLLDLRWVHRSHGDLNREMFIEMKLGKPPKLFYLHVDTGSGPTWVLCSNGESLSTISTVGPNGLFVSEEECVVKCIGPTEFLCRAHSSHPEHGLRCEEEDDYACYFSIIYADRSVYLGVVVNESMTLPMQDASERNVFSLFGCEGSLVDQMWTSKVIKQKVLGVCLAKEIRLRPLVGLRPTGRVGFISLGMDFEEKFDENNLVWSKLVGPEKDCMLAAKLLLVGIGNRKITGIFESGDGTDVGTMMGFDTGSEMSYFCKDVYDRVLKTLETFTTDGEYIRAQDHAKYKRECWEYRAKIGIHGGNPLGKASPIDDFPALEFGFEGFTTMKSSLPTELHPLTVQPENYLTWDAQRRSMCVNILEELDDPHMSILGGQWAHF